MVSKTVELVEVGPRDGLQNEPNIVSIEKKVQLIDALSGCGFKRIEVGSFVNPKLVPQMADSGEVCRMICRPDGVRFSALVPNLRGLDSAMAADVHEIAVFASASEGFSEANINASIEEGLKRLKEVVRSAISSGLKVRGYVSCVVQCPYDGPTKPEAVVDVAMQLIEAGCFEISLGDTIGVGTPSTVGNLLEKLVKKIPVKQLAGHYHDTNGSALKNILESIKFGIRTFDTAIGGLGGCPFARGSPGNAATEAIHDALSIDDWYMGLSRSALQKAATAAESIQEDRKARN